MSKEQIDEMAYSVCRLKNKPESCTSCMWKTSCNGYLSAESYYNAGYRKQSEGEWVKSGKGITERVECSNCGGCVRYQIIDGKWAYENYCSHCGAKMKGGAE